MVGASAGSVQVNSIGWPASAPCSWRKAARLAAAADASHYRGERIVVDTEVLKVAVRGPDGVWRRPDWAPFAVR